MIFGAQGLDRQLDSLTAVAWNWMAVFLPRLGAAIAILVAGMLIARWLSRAVERLLLATTRIDPALKPIATALIRYAILILTIVATLEQLGFQTTSLLAVLGAAGLAIGLALQGTLSNIAAGIMLLWLRPFHMGDYIEVAGQGGAVQEIGLFGCRLQTFDGLFLFLPNSVIWNAALKNHTRNGGRLISVDVVVPADSDVKRMRELLVTTASETKDVLKTPAPRAFLENLSDKGLVFTVSFWASPQGAGDVERAVIECIKHAVESLGPDVKPTQITRTIPADADPSRYLERREPFWLH